MKVQAGLKVVAALAALSFIAAACGDDDDDDEGATATTEQADGGEDLFVEVGGWNDGPCDESEPAVVVGLTAPIDAPGLNFADSVDATEASVEAFNARGGINGRCLEVKICDGHNSAPDELACAREQVDDASIVSGLSTKIYNAEGEAYDLFEAAGLAQVGPGNSSPGGWNSPVSYDIGGGGPSSFAYIPPLESAGATKIAVIFPETAQSGAFTAFAAPLFKALDIEQVDLIQIPPTAVDFTQYVLRAEQSGADGIMLGLTRTLALQFLDAMDSVSSDLFVSVNFSQFNKEIMLDLPEDIVANMVLFDFIPPLSSDFSEFPILEVIADDLAASGEDNLQPETVGTGVDWMQVYAFVKVLRDANLTEYTRETVRQAFDQATDVDMLGMTSPWTPSATNDNPVFMGIANAKFWSGTWDGDAEQFVVDVDAGQFDVLELLSEGG